MDDAPPSLALEAESHSLSSLLVRLLTVGGLLVVVHLVVHVAATDAAWGPLADWTDLDDDQSVGSWFSSLQYLAVAVAALLARRETAHPGALSRRFLLAVAAVALFLSLDEMFGIHERITDLAESRDIGPLKAVMINGSGAWIAVYAVLAMVLLVAGRRDLGALWRDYRPDLRPAVLGVVLLGIGEVGFEVLGYLVLDEDLGGRAYQVQVAAEEWAAMAGMSLVLYSVLLVLARSQAVAARERAESSAA